MRIDEKVTSIRTDDSIGSGNMTSEKGKCPRFILSN